MEGNQDNKSSQTLGVMERENARWFSVLKSDPQFPAYYISYQVQKNKNTILSAQAGSIVDDRSDEDKRLDVEVRVGTPRLDNTHEIPDRFQSRVQRRALVPLDNSPAALQSQLWLETDRRYRESSLQYRMVVTNENVNQRNPGEPDFVHEKPIHFVEPIKTLNFNKEKWVKRLKGCSVRAERGIATRANCQLLFSETTNYFVNSEGTKIRTSWTNARLLISVGVKADDGMPLSRTEEYFVRDPEDLPNEDEMEKMIDRATKDLDALHKAPIVDPFVGPTILQGRAAAVFFH